jgi:putative oxidoreductase
MSKEKSIEVTHYLLRVIAGLLMMQHGGQKIFDWFGGSPGGHPAAWSQIWFGGMIEFWGGLLVMIGLLTRPAAFLLSGTMAVAYFQFHHKMELFWPMQNKGEAAVLYCFIFLFICAYGGGRLSLDALIQSKRKSGRSV